ncbi:hypothetical protein C8K44_12044 [Aminobacter sp. AP02]|nr:hypothetical protein C8K44_12044 [Aminobacter sp. AP02]
MHDMHSFGRAHRYTLISLVLTRWSAVSSAPNRADRPLASVGRPFAPY